ncbi:MAG: class I SAM-dependent methyltransferase [Leptospirillia bacterium]
MTETQPDWNRIAQKFDLWLPHLAPVTDHLLDGLQADNPRRILDMACGTGEPALTLAMRYPDASITLVDAAAGMVNVARKKAETAGLENLRFGVMPAESLQFPDAAFDRVVCRFGVMLFTDPVAGLGEMWRVLTPGGRFALSVWGGPDEVPALTITVNALNLHLPEDTRSQIVNQVTSLGPEGVLDGTLQSAGFGDFEISRHILPYTFPDFDAYWDLVQASEILKAQFDALTPDQHDQVRDEVARIAGAYQSDGHLVLPQVYLVASGHKPSV